MMRCINASYGDEYHPYDTLRIEQIMLTVHIFLYNTYSTYVQLNIIVNIKTKVNVNVIIYVKRNSRRTKERSTEKKEKR